MTYTFGSAAADGAAGHDMALLLGAVIAVLALVAYLPVIVHGARRRYMFCLLDEYCADVEAGLRPCIEKFVERCPKELRFEFRIRAEFKEDEIYEARMHGLR
jgi:hypothetical protein